MYIETDADREFDEGESAIYPNYPAPSNANVKLGDRLRFNVSGYPKKNALIVTELKSDAFIGIDEREAGYPQERQCPYYIHYEAIDIYRSQKNVKTVR